jgi:transposase InsO family protein
LVSLRDLRAANGAVKLVRVVHTKRLGLFRQPRTGSTLPVDGWTVSPVNRIIDDYSRLTWVDFLKEKAEAFEKFKILKALTKNQIGKRLQAVRSDRGGEFMSSDFKEFCDKHGIKREYTIPGTPQQNGVVERQNRIVHQLARSMMNENNIVQTYWVEEIHTTIHILNKAHLRPHSDKTRYELWYGIPTSIKHLKVFRSK